MEDGFRKAKMTRAHKSQNLPLIILIYCLVPLCVM